MSYSSIFLREGRDLTGLLLGEGNIASINALVLMSRWGLEGGYV